MEVKVFEELDVLVAELSKEDPDETLVRRKMYKLGIGYCSDPVERLNRVLLALHPLSEQEYPSGKSR
ncbi:MAG: hypothetical protein ABL958_00045 [Bdellovibrionia bacterium]